MAASSLPPLADILPPLVLGGGGFSYQLISDPQSIPISDVIKSAFEAGIRAIDTSPYYEPSEQLLGKALSQPEIANHYSRSEHVLMTKVGRITADKSDYSATWVRQSVNRSLERLGATYLDVVFCHDIEFVTDEETIEAVGELLEFVRNGKVRYIGLSSYFIPLLSRRANMSSRLETEGLKAFNEAGVSCVLNASPLAIGLLRAGRVPQGRLGDFHPAPAGLRKAAQDAGAYVSRQGDNLAALALRYAVWRSVACSNGSVRVCTITGISSIADLTENVEAVQKVLLSTDDTSRRLSSSCTINQTQVEKDLPLFQKVQEILGGWVNYSLINPEVG
ncbi:hypothetical protein LTR99_005680 [Exophiala xenobiotica]|nr:hypothetical protein LTR96_004797 [Exophiala xenobiotica]KAK5302723.1 hypothetical protein LTR99_005680 [Exophiala xenobiotica]KAK5340418.1 hypothetical protein LTR98_003540 [Exophiala xenobiotica]KAK5430917.1 hypothetical protein LTR34_005476 [Exophiala xenobiotica]KAK5540306.1 hypothetical protein LTR23_006403 [Chaetothyriales sp. CCFEE 6169]